MHGTDVGLVGRSSEPTLGAWVVLPTFNEADNVEKIIAAIGASAAAPSIVGIVAVDDNSPDRTADRIRELQRAYPNLHLVVRSQARSFAQSYLDGFSYALSHGAKSIVQMDADGSHDPAAIAQLLAQLATHDVAVGSRYVPGGRTENWGLGRRAVSLVGNLWARAILGRRIHDLTSGFVAWRSSALRELNFSRASCRGYVFQISLKEAALRAGLRAAEVPIIFRERKRGASKFHLGIVAESFTQVLKLRFSETIGLW